MHDAEGACSMDSRDSKHRAIAIRAGQPAEVSDVVRTVRFRVRSRAVRRAGTPVHQRPRLTLRVLPTEYRVLGVQAAHGLRHTRPADDDQAVTVEIDLTAHLDVAGADVEPVRLAQLFESLPGVDVGHGHDRALLLAIPAQRSDDRDGARAEEGSLGGRAGMPDLMNPPAAQAGLFGNLRVRQPLRVKVLNHTTAKPGKFGHLLLRVGQPRRDLTQEQVRIIDRHDPLQLVRHNHTS